MIVRLVWGSAGRFALYPSTRVTSVFDHGPVSPLESAQRAQYTTHLGSAGTGNSTSIGFFVNERRYQGRPSNCPGNSGIGSSCATRSTNNSIRTAPGGLAL